jgi:hypothetical protein
LLNNIPKSLVNLLKQEPKGLKEMPTMRWREIGPISLSDVIKFNNKEIDYENNEIGKSSKSFNFDIFG